MTRGWLPYDNQIAKKLERWKIFENCSTLVQDLFTLLYGSQKKFAEVSELEIYKTLESILLFYNQLLGLTDTPLFISKRMEISTPLKDNSNTDYLLYNKLYFYIKAFSEQTPSFTDNSVPPLSLTDGIQMNETQWKQYSSQYFKDESLPYDTRTDFIMGTFYNL